MKNISSHTHRLENTSGLTDSISVTEFDKSFIWLLPLFAPSFEVYIIPAKEFVDVESCVFWYESYFMAFMALAFGVADVNWLAGVA